jgi:prepilin-type processing-associated H-X9-DG protein
MYEETGTTASNLSAGDNQGLYAGYEWDNHRVAWHPASAVANGDPLTYQPRQDTIGIDLPNIYAFGSAHSGGMNMSMCDGSVQTISYEIDHRIHQYLASRLDGEIAKLQP